MKTIDCGYSLLHMAGYSVCLLLPLSIYIIVFALFLSTQHHLYVMKHGIGGPLDSAVPCPHLFNKL